MACAMETTRVSLEDCTCPICMCILIEPVTMPCHHELCRPCFKQNVEEASLLCPMCRTRIGTWARHATKTKTLVNQGRWEQIQGLFPKRVRLRLEGKDEEDDTADVTYHAPVHIAAPGEIRREYEAELKRLRQQLLQERRREEEESRNLIQKLQQEEEQKHKQHHTALQQITEEDEALARELDKVINEAGTDDPFNVLLGESKSRLTRSNSTTSSKSPHSNAGTLETFFSKSRPGAEARTPSDPYPYACISPSDKDKGERSSRSDSSLSKLSISSSVKNETLPFILSTLNDHTYCPNPATEKSSTVARPPSSEIVTISDTSSEGEKGKAEGVNERSGSALSNDSISNELCHFKPILSCPRTPPKRMANGKVVEPPVVRTTPRNLSRNGFGSPVDQVKSPGLEPGSPIMQRRLSELAQERQMQVQERSKSTSTGQDTGSVKPDTKLRKERTSVDELARPPLHETSLSDACIGESLGSELLIPLEPVLEDHDYDDFTPVLLRHANVKRQMSSPLDQGKPDLKSEDLVVNSHSVRSPVHEKHKRSRHKSKDQKAQIASPQRSIKHWFQTENKKSDQGNVLRNDSGASELDYVPQVVCNGKKCDSVDVAKVVKGPLKTSGKTVSHSAQGSDCVTAKNNKRHKGVASDTANQTPKKGSKRVKKGDLIKGDLESSKDPMESSPAKSESEVRGVKRKGKKTNISEAIASLENEVEIKRDNKKNSPGKCSKRGQKSEVETPRKAKSFADEVEGEVSDADSTSSEVLFSVRKSRRARKSKVVHDEDYEFDVDGIRMSDSDASRSTSRPQDEDVEPKDSVELDPVRTKRLGCEQLPSSDDSSPASTKNCAKTSDDLKPGERKSRKRQKGIDDSSKGEVIPDARPGARNMQKMKRGKSDKDGTHSLEVSKGFNDKSESGNEIYMQKEKVKTRRKAAVKHTNVQSDETEIVNCDSQITLKTSELQEEHPTPSKKRKVPRKESVSESPAKKSPKTSPKKVNKEENKETPRKKMKGPVSKETRSRDKESKSSPVKKQSVEETGRKHQVSTRRHQAVKHLAEEFSEENVDPNANCNNSSLTSPKVQKRRKREASVVATMDSVAHSPSKRARTRNITEEEDVENAPRTKRTTSLSSVDKVHASHRGKPSSTNRQQSIMKYFKGSENTEIESDETSEPVTQEDEDRLLAEKLQRQFDLERKLNIHVERFKGSEDQYQLRKAPKYSD